MEKSIYQLILNWGFLLLFIPALISFYRFHQRSIEMKALSLFVYLMLFFEVIVQILANLGMSNLFIIHIYTPVEFYFYCFIFRRHIMPPLNKSFFTALIVLFTSLALANNFFLQGFAQFNSYTRVLESMIFIGFAVLLLFQLFGQEETTPLPKKPMFWFACGVLLYFSGNLFIFIFSNFLLQYYLHLNKYVWAFNALINDVTYILFAIALWKDARK